MKLAIIDKKNTTLSLQNNTIKCEEQTVPFRLVDTLVLNHAVRLETKDLLKLTKNDISVLIVAYNNEHSCLIASSQTKAGDLKLRQYRSLSQHMRFVQYFLSHKFKTHQQHLQKHEITFDVEKQTAQLYDSKSIQSALGIEGNVARAYNKHLFTLFPANMHQSKRSKQPPLDSVNAVLSFWYSLYYNREACDAYSKINIFCPRYDKARAAAAG